MRIALIESTRFPPQEGLGNYVWNLSKNLQNLGHDVSIFTRGSKLSEQRRTVEGITVTEVFTPPLYPFHVDLHGVLLQRAVDRQGPFDVIHMNSPLPPPINSKTPILLTFHTPVLTDTASIPTTDLTSKLYRLQTPFSVRVEKKLIARARRISAVSPSVAGDLRAYGIRASDVLLLENGVDPTVFRQGAQRRGEFLLCTGRLGPRKGHSDLLEAMRTLKDGGFTRDLVVTGRGPYEEILRRQARKLGIEGQVRFAGFVPTTELVALLQACAMFVFPSHYEGLPTSVLEAMSTACPIVAAAAPGVIDLLENGRNARLFPIGNAPAMASAIESVYKDNALKTAIGKAAHSDVTAYYAWPKIAAKAEHIYGTL